MVHRQFPINDPERRKWQDPEKILTDIGLKRGMTFVDVGCGDGYFSIPAARMVGQEGKVIAIDIDKGSIMRLQQKAAEEGFGNLSAEAHAAEETIACEGCADFVFFGIDLHDFADPAQVIRNAGQMLRPSGLLVDLDWKPEPMSFGPPLEKRFSIGKAQQLIESAGFHTTSVNEAGPYHYIIIARL
ncbi:MAG: class I SAM-dependent methyltransferase [Dehalobacter sp.]|nr:class I SAM-dependent methyltransferase [Dehalobacter sp.]